MDRKNVCISRKETIKVPVSITRELVWVSLLSPVRKVEKVYCLLPLYFIICDSFTTEFSRIFFLSCYCTKDYTTFSKWLTFAVFSLVLLLLLLLLLALPLMLLRGILEHKKGSLTNTHLEFPLFVCLQVAYNTFNGNSFPERRWKKGKCKRCLAVM